MRILDVEKKTGLDRATIRFYENEGLAVPVRQENGYRSYSDADVELLLKIKLLRQVGLSIDKIRNLQQGSVSFSSVLAQQIELINKQMQDEMNAKQICLMMQQEHVQFQTLDATRYLNLMTEKTACVKKDFQENVPKEWHPWRRYFARQIDRAVITAFLSFLFVVLLRIRPFSGDALRVLNYFSYLLAIPILAALQHHFGTTPGKWAMGIRLEHVNGGNLSFKDAIQREFSVFCLGEGLHIPFISIWRLYKSFKNDADEGGNPWNKDTEIIYTDWTKIKKATLGLLAISSLALSWSSSSDAILPKYRGNDITLPEFVRNYQDYEKTLSREGQYTLSEDGLWNKFSQSAQNVVIIDGDLEHIRANFTYEFNNDGYIKSLNYKDQWEDRNFFTPIPAYCATALYAILGSRPACTQKDLIMAEELIVSETSESITNASKQGQFSGQFQVRDVRVSWNICTNNRIAVTGNGMIVNLGEDRLAYSLDFTVEILCVSQGAE